MPQRERESMTEARDEQYSGNDNETVEDDVTGHGMPNDNETVEDDTEGHGVQINDNEGVDEG